MTTDSQETLRSIVKAKQTALGIETFLEAILKKLGGPLGFAQMIGDDIEKLDPGHANRIRLEIGILNLLEKVGIQLGDETEETPEQVEAELRRQMTLMEPDDAD